LLEPSNSLTECGPAGLPVGCLKLWKFHPFQQRVRRDADRLGGLVYVSLREQMPRKGQGSIYSANLTLRNDDMNQLFVGTQMMTEARWPNGGDLFHVNWATLGAGTSDSQLIDSNLASTDWTGAKVHLLSGQDPWSPQTATVTASSSGQLTITLDDLDYPPYILPQAGGRYYLYRSLSALDVPGEWFYDPSKQILYFWAPENLNPNGLNVRAKRREYGFDLSGRSGVTIQNIALFACGINMSTSSANNIIDGINSLYLFHFTDMPAVSASNPTGYWYTHVMDSGIVLNGSGNVLRNSTINWSAGNGVTLQGTGNTVTNNLILNTGYAGNQGGGAISLFGTQHAVRNNTMRFSGRYLVTIYSFPVNPDHNDVGYNNLWNAMMLGLDGGAIYSGNANVTGTRIHHNWVHDTNTPIQFPGMYTRNGIYIDENASGFEVDQNIVWNNEFFNIFLHGHTSGVATPFNNYIHNNSIPDVSADGNIELQGPILCGTTQIQDNFVLLPVLQVQMTTPCPASNNNATAPGATDMTPSVQVGCNFAGCSSPAPPAVSGTTVTASIEVQPLSAAVGAGQAATFSVIAAGSPPLAYQWLRNGVVIPGATGAAYTTPATSFADNGAVFAVQATNAFGSVTSSPAVLAIGTTPLLMPAITSVLNAESGSPTFAPNTWVAIAGLSLAPAGDVRIWQGETSRAG
jgi:parallel beta helix pectate lyase-like protein